MAQDVREEKSHLGDLKNFEILLFTYEPEDIRLVIKLHSFLVHL